MNLIDSIAHLGLRLLKFNQRLDTEMNSGRIQSPLDLPSPPPKLEKKFLIHREQIHNNTMYTIQPKGIDPKEIIFFLHGGAYVHNSSHFHWEFIGEMVQSLKVKCLYLDYPLAPDSKCKAILSFVETAYSLALEEYPDSHFRIMGDSAGAGLALALFQKLKAESKKQPSEYILLSPWLDVRMTNPEIPSLAEKDLILSSKGLIMAGEAYAGDLSTSHPWVSPITNQDWHGLPKTTILIGTHDILYPDSKLFHNTLVSQNRDHTWEEFPEMLHDWFLFPTPNGKKGRMRIFEILCR
jgi:acetyl esterase/lipase